MVHIQTTIGSLFQVVDYSVSLSAANIIKFICNLKF